jgi:hypothetical protein
VVHQNFSDESGESFSGNDWAKGFMRGTEFHRADWLDLMDNEEEGGALVAIFALFRLFLLCIGCLEYVFQRPVSEELREKLLINLSAGVMHIYRYFEPQRKMASQLARYDRSGVSACLSSKSYGCVCYGQSGHRLAVPADMCESAITYGWAQSSKKS